MTLPCNHQYCSVCLEGWRSKYGSLRAKTCPQCRSKIPPTKEMVSQLRTNERILSVFQHQLVSSEPLPLPSADGTSHCDGCYVDLPNEKTRRLFHRMDPTTQQTTLRELLRVRISETEANVMRLREQVDGFENMPLEHNEEEPCQVLPMKICFAAGKNDVPKVLEWLYGPSVSPDPFSGATKVPPERLNAKNPDKMERTLLHEAEFEGHTGLMSILLQHGAKVDPKSCFGMTPLHQACCYKSLDHAARLLLEWGADISNPELVKQAESSGNAKLARLLETPLGGRRCQISGLEKRTDLNGLTGIAEKYFPKSDRYAVVVEQTEESFQIRTSNLKRRDRTPDDVGQMIVFHERRKDGTNMFSRNLCISQKHGDNDTEWFRRRREEAQKQ